MRMLSCVGPAGLSQLLLLLLRLLLKAGFTHRSTSSQRFPRPLCPRTWKTTLSAPGDLFLVITIGVVVHDGDSSLHKRSDAEA